ncbi:MAG TPA: hypothetical protein VFQ32_04470 [Ktedonobacterales bacterium]|nr:hypothetical protein [Ktedonobacterales bacterium]
MYDAPDPREDAALEILPPDLLPIHQRLEHDGGSWRASLPAPDTLLHRVRERPSRDSYPREDRAEFQSAALSASSLACPIALRPHSRRKDTFR